MNLFYFTQIFPKVPKFEWNCFNYPNSIEAIAIYPNVSDCIQISIKHFYISQIGMKLCEVVKFGLVDWLYPNVSNLCKYNRLRFSFAQM